MLDMTKGNIRSYIIKFSTPLFIGNILQIVNNFVDRIWAGKFLGEKELGAISISGNFYFVMLAISIGFSIATSIIISQYFGAKKVKTINRIVGNSFVLNIIFAIGVIIILSFFLDDIIYMSSAPDEVAFLVKEYMSILIYTVFFVFILNVISASFRGIGDSKTPLIILFITVLTNAVLDPILMLGLFGFPRLGIKGASIALLVGNINAVLFGLYFMKRNKLLTIKSSSFIVTKQIISKILVVSYPLCIRFILISCGVTLLQIEVNKFGTNAIAAFAVSSSIDNLIVQPSLSIGAAVSIMVGQNIGANRIDRVYRILKEGILLVIYIIPIFSLISLFLPKIFIFPFMNDPSGEAFHIATSYLRIIGIPYIFLCITLVISSLLEGAGQTLISMILTLFNLWCIRIPLAKFLGKKMGITGLFWGIGISFILSTIFIFLYYRSGRWEKKIQKL